MNLSMLRQRWGANMYIRKSTPRGVSILIPTGLSHLCRDLVIKELVFNLAQNNYTWVNLQKSSLASL